MNRLMSYLDNGVRALLVFSLAQAAKAVMVLGMGTPVKIYCVQAADLF